MDIHMPDMDGLEAARKLMEMGCTTPIVALTANIMTTDREIYFELGMRDCLSKPFVAHELWTCLLKFIKPVSMMPIKSSGDYVDDGDQKLDLIAAFVKSNQTTISDINNALESGNVKLAHRLTHTLKSVAGIVGMTALTEAAQIVERSLSYGKVQFIQEEITKLENELHAALAELTPLVESQKSKTVKQTANNTFNKESALKLLEKLDTLLTSDSFDCLNFVDDLNMIQGTGELVFLVENMKFKLARDELAAVKLKVENEYE